MFDESIEFHGATYRNKSVEIAHRNLQKLKGRMSKLDDAKRLIVLQQLSILFRDKKFLANNEKCQSAIISLMDSIGDRLSDEFLLHTFGPSCTFDQEELFTS